MIRPLAYYSRHAVLSAIFIMGGMENAIADEVARQRGPAFGDQTNVRRQISVSGQANEQRQRLDLLAYEIFDPSVPTLDYKYFRVKASELFKRFGVPNTTNVNFYAHRDPPPGGPTQIEELTWQFPGMVMDITAYPPPTSGYPDEILISRIEITSPAYDLKDELKVGQPAAKFIAQLGNPNVRNKAYMSYFVEDHVQVKPAVYDVSAYQIQMALNDSDIVTKITWTWGWH